MKKKITTKTNSETIQKGKWLMKEYIKNIYTGDIKDIFKIGLRMWDVKKNYPKNDTDTICPICRKKRRYNRTFARL